MLEMYIIGGSHGVGKSTIIKELSYCNIPIIHSGDYFHSCVDKEKGTDNLVEDISKSNTNLILDTHYAGNTEHGFMRSLKDEHLVKLSETYSIDCILLDLDTKTLLHRKWLDRDIRVRKHDYDITENDLKKNRVYFNQYCNLLNIKGHHIFNYYLLHTIYKVKKIIKKC